MAKDPFADYKAIQRETWATFAPQSIFTTPPAASLVRFASVRRGDFLLDVASGTGVVAVTAARAGAKVCALDLSPALLAEARASASLCGVEIEFSEGDIEALPYPQAGFDVVLSQYGHIFAPRPELAISEMLRVLKNGGRIAFSTWPLESLVGQIFELVANYLPRPAGVPSPAPWGDPTIVRQRLGAAVTDVAFDWGRMTVPALSPQHYRAWLELHSVSITKVIAALATDSKRLDRFRSEVDSLIAECHYDNLVHQSFLMTRALKR
jgi:SAM-dependent methyltransferase